MTQGMLPFKYERDKQGAGMTALAGLPVYLDLAYVMNLSRSIDEHLRVRANGQGWTDSEVVTALVLLNLAGGDCVTDLEILESDEGFCRILNRIRLSGMTRKERRATERRWRKEQRRSFPSPSAVFRYLGAFHDQNQEKLRQPGKAFIPAPNEHLRGFAKVNKDILGFVQKKETESIATLDMDATLSETNKVNALFCYDGFKSYQPLNTWWAEQGLIVHTEFRDGNVPAGYQQLRVFKEALECLPEGVEKVRLRSDTAGYQHELLKYCEVGEDKRFGRIEFAISCDVTSEFRKAVAEVAESEWRPEIKIIKDKQVATGRQWSEVCFVPNAIGHGKKGPAYRYLAIREKLSEQLSFSEMETQEQQYSFPTMVNNNHARYKIFGIVSNMDWEGNALVQWLHERCGKSEEAHGVMKQDLAGGKFPSGDFGENAAWWWSMILALNLNQAMKSLVLGVSWVSKRMKAIRFSLINLPGRVMNRSRELLVRLSRDHPVLDWLIEIRTKILRLAATPSG